MHFARLLCIKSSPAPLLLDRSIERNSPSPLSASTRSCCAYQGTFHSAIPPPSSDPEWILPVCALSIFIKIITTTDPADVLQGVPSLVGTFLRCCQRCVQHASRCVPGRIPRGHIFALLKRRRDAGHAPRPSVRPRECVMALPCLPYVLYPSERATHAAKEPHFGALIGKSEIFIAFCRQQF